jgi:hypothetical protein
MVGGVMSSDKRPYSAVPGYEVPQQLHCIQHLHIATARKRPAAEDYPMCAQLLLRETHAVGSRLSVSASQTDQDIARCQRRSSAGRVSVTLRQASDNS